VPDVLIETEFTVWALLTLAGRDLDDGRNAPVDQVLRTIDAAAWYAGNRECAFGLIVTDPARAPRAVARVRHYARHPSHVRNRLPTGVGELRHLGAIGVACWSDLVEILEDCATSAALAPAERAFASRTLEWLTQIRDPL
jgi:hypothetical protein